jgi:DNA-directed RNA polymerase subunit RPC12/RpoP
MGRKAGKLNCSADFPELFMNDNESKCPVTGKRKYETEGEALATAAHQIATGHAPEELSAYRCNWCSAWHLTKNPRPTGKRSR